MSQAENTPTQAKRKIVLLEFISLDGVIQAPGGRDEDDTENFDYGGWTVPYMTGEGEATKREMDLQMHQPFDLLLGRKTYAIFADYWPKHEAIWPEAAKATKYVVSHEPQQSSWETTVQITGEDIAGQLRKLKESDGPMLQVYGSSVLAQTLLSKDLVDEIWLKIYPLTIGQGKKLFGEGTRPATFTLTKLTVSDNGVLFANYSRAGDMTSKLALLVNEI